MPSDLRTAAHPAMPSPAAADPEPTSTCIRCGRTTPAGVSLCDADNPGRIKSPSATQVHGTILAGVIVGLVGFLLLARLAVGQGGPYASAVTGRATLAGGAAQVVVHVTNNGKGSGVATCRVTRDGSPRPDDLVFRTDRLEPGASVDVTRQLPPTSTGQPPYVLDLVTATCT